MGPFVLTRPSADADNTVQPTADGVTAVTLKWASATQSNPMLLVVDDTGAVLAQIDFGGQIQGTKLNLRPTDPTKQMLTGNVANNTTAGVAQVALTTNRDAGGVAQNEVDILTDGSSQWIAHTTGAGANFRTQAKLIPSWRDANDASRKAQISFQLRGAAAATMEALNLSTDGANPALGALGATPVVRQVGASAAALAAIVDPNAQAALTALQNALAAFGLVTAPA